MTKRRVSIPPSYSTTKLQLLQGGIVGPLARVRGRQRPGALCSLDDAGDAAAVAVAEQPGGPG